MFKNINFKNINFKNKYSIFVLLFIICLFVTISIIYYKRIVQPRLNEKYIANNEFIPDTQSTLSPISAESATATLYYFYTTWCPHCKTANPYWESLQTDTNGIINGVQVIFKSVDCDKDTEMAEKFKIINYPTIKLIYNNTIYNYDAKPDTNTLIKFLKSVIVAT